MRHHIMLFLALITISGLASCTQADQAGTPAPATPTETSAAITTPVQASSTTTTSESSATDRIGDLEILFVGNSHTATHDIPTTVASLLNSSPGYHVTAQFVGSEFLRVALQNSSVIDTITEGSWDIVVLQGQEISRSHTVDYSRFEAIELAQLVAESGARPLFFSEWSRREIDETAYIENIYVGIAAMADAEVIPVGRSWDRYLKSEPEALLWAEDGNHSSAEGAFLAAATIASFIAGPDAELATDARREPLLEAARLTVAEYRVEVGSDSDD